MEDDARFGSASLSQVAALVGLTEDEVAAEARIRIGEEAARRGWLRADAVTALTADVVPLQPLSDAEPLILKAFRQAQEASKAEWTSMTVPVLKNRLLQISSNTFRELDYGSPNIWHFVTLFPGLLATEGVRPNEQVRLMKPEKIEARVQDKPAELDPAGTGQIRPDLWRAIFDYSANKHFVWDEAVGRARVHSDSDRETMLVMPTLSAQDLAQLRSEFIQLQQNVPDRDSERLLAWLDRSGPTAGLPPLYRGLWNAHLKSHAANRLRAFFLAHGLDVPKDLVARASMRAEPEREVEQIRRLVHRYVDAMTAEELARLSIEVGVVMRVPAYTER